MDAKQLKDQKAPLIDKKQESAIGGVQDVQNYKLCGRSVDLPLIALCILNFFLNAACSVITPFFPPLAEGSNVFPDNPLSVSNGVIGMIIGIHPIGGFFFGFFVSKFMMRIGRKVLMLWSLIVTVITLTAMGLCYHLRYHQNWFIATALVARFFMGAARSGYGSTTFAYAPLLWPTQIPKMIGIMETATGVGLMLGPLIGAGLNSMFTNHGLGYQMVFYILSGIFLIMIYPGIKLLPKEVPVQGKQQVLNIGNVMKRPNVLALFFLLTNSSFALTYVYPLWTNVMNYCYGVNENIATVYLTIGTVTYIATLLSMPVMIKATQGDKKFLLSLGLFLAIISTQLMAPATWLGLPRKDYIVVIGLFISGASNGFAILPFIPELRELIMEIYPDPKFIHMVGDMASGLFYAAYSFGTFIGPTVGGFIYDSYTGEYIPETQQYVGNGSIQKYCANPKHKNVDSCVRAEAFTQLSDLITYATIFFTVMYMTVGRGYQGWMKVFGSKSSKKALPTHKQNQQDQQLLGKNQPTNNNQQPMTSTKEGMSDMIMTDSEAGEDFEFGKRAQKGSGKPAQTDEEKQQQEEEEIAKNSRGSFIM